MAIVGALTKQPREIVAVDLDYTQAIDGRTVSLITPSIEAPSGMALESAQVDGSVLQVYMSGGTAGQVYRWTVLTDIVIGGRTTRLEDEWHVLVEEVTADMTGTPDAVATTAGTAAPIVTKRTADARTYVIDCCALLRKNELMTTITGSTADAGLTLGSSSLLQGRFIEITVSGGTVPDGSPHKDYTVRVTATTTRGTVQAEVTVRVYP